MSNITIYQNEEFDMDNFEVSTNFKITNEQLTDVIKKQTSMIIRNKAIRKLTRNIEIEKHREINYQKKLHAHYFLEELTREDNKILQDITRMNKALDLCSVIFYSNDSAISFEELKTIVSIHKHFTKETLS